MRAEKGGPGRQWPRPRLHVAGRVAGQPALGLEQRVRCMIQPWLEILDGECYQVDMCSSPRQVLMSSSCLLQEKRGQVTTESGFTIDAIHSAAGNNL